MDPRIEWKFETNNWEKMQRQSTCLPFVSSRQLTDEEDRVQKANFEILAAGVQALFDANTEKLLEVKRMLEVQQGQIDEILKRLPITVVRRDIAKK